MMNKTGPATGPKAEGARPAQAESPNSEVSGRPARYKGPAGRCHEHSDRCGAIHTLAFEADAAQAELVAMLGTPKHNSQRELVLCNRIEWLRQAAAEMGEIDVELGSSTWAGGVWPTLEARS